MAESFIAKTDLPLWVKSGDIKGSKYLQAVDYFRESSVWDKWALGALFALGAGHILAAIIFFFAFNWSDLSGAMKFNIVQGAIVMSVLAWLALRLDRVPAQAFGIAATVLIGVLLAVFGQVYQTPAAIYTPFILWAVLSFPFATASKSVAHWAVWLAIAVFASLTYIGGGLARTSGSEAARWGFLALGAALLFLSALYHWVSRTKFLWAQTSWFRLAILTTAYVILFILFTESFWIRNFDVVWVLVLVLMGGALAVIYKTSPTLPTLSLTTFALTAMISQFGFKIIFDVLDISSASNSLFMTMLMSFIWALCLTVFLAKAFRHFQLRFGTGPGDVRRDVKIEDIEDTDQPKALSDFASVLNCDAEALDSVIEQGHEDTAPWYIETLLGVAGVITAIFAMALLGSFVALFLSGNDSSVYAGFGFIVWVVAVFFRRRASSKFVQYFCNMFVLGGGGLAFGAVADMLDWNASFVFFGIAMSLLTLFLVRDSIIEFVMALGVFGLISYGLYEFNVPRPYIWACILFTALAVIGLAWPFKNRLYDAAGTAFLFAVPIASATYEKGAALEGLGIKAHWIEILTSLVVTVLAVVFLNRINREQDMFRPALGVFIPMLLAMAIMPLGSAAALLVVIVGYIFGSRALTLMGILMQIGFLTLFYYDLQISLLHKSFLLAASGLIFVGIWWFFRKIGDSVHV